MPDDDVINVERLLLGRCGNCNCFDVHVGLAFEDGTVFADFALSPEGARQLATGLAQCADLFEAQQLAQDGRLT